MSFAGLVSDMDMGIVSDVDPERGHTHPEREDVSGQEIFFLGCFTSSIAAFMSQRLIQRLRCSSSISGRFFSFVEPECLRKERSTDLMERVTLGLEIDQLVR